MTTDITKETIPEGSEYYTDDGFRIEFYKEVRAFNLRLLECWNVYRNRWVMCGYHPWAELIEIPNDKK